MLHLHQKLVFKHFADPLTFLLAPPSGQIIYTSQHLKTSIRLIGVLCFIVTCSSKMYVSGAIVRQHADVGIQPRALLWLSNHTRITQAFQELILVTHGSPVLKTLATVMHTLILHMTDPSSPSPTVTPTHWCLTGKPAWAFWFCTDVSCYKYSKVPDDGSTSCALHGPFHHSSLSKHRRALSVLSQQLHH